MKIIIVDDSLLDRKLLSRTLANNGVKNEVLQADNGEAGLALVAAHLGDIALIFMDYQMPGMTGLEVIQGLLKVPATAEIPVVMVTASASDESRQAAYQVNPRLVGYILKPFKPEQVISVIRPYVEMNG